MSRIFTPEQLWLTEWNVVFARLLFKKCCLWIILKKGDLLTYRRTTHLRTKWFIEELRSKKRGYDMCTQSFSSDDIFKQFHKRKNLKIYHNFIDIRDFLFNNVNFRRFAKCWKFTRKILRNFGNFHNISGMKIEIDIISLRDKTKIFLFREIFLKSCCLGKPQKKFYS